LISFIEKPPESEGRALFTYFLNYRIRASK